MKFVSVLFVAFVAIVVLSNQADAVQDPMFEFYDGLSDVIEQNLNDAQGCLKAVEKYLKDNKKLIDTMTAMTQRGQNMAQQQDYENMSDEEMKQKFEQGIQLLSQSKGVEAVNRFMDVAGQFSMNNPDEADALFQTIEDHMPKPENEEMY